MWENMPKGGELSCGERPGISNKTWDHTTRPAAAATNVASAAAATHTTVADRTTAGNITCCLAVPHVTVFFISLLVTCRQRKS